MFSEYIQSPSTLEDLQASDKFHRALFQSAPDAMLIVDRLGRIQNVNAQLSRLFGYAADALVCQPLERLVPERLRAAHRQHLNAYLAHPVPRPMGTGRELSGMKQDGEELPVEVSLSPLFSGDGILRAADSACYMAKDTGRHRIHVYHEDDAALVRRHSEMQWVSRITHALEED